jgi:hypothetical protein
MVLGQSYSVTKGLRTLFSFPCILKPRYSVYRAASAQVSTASVPGELDDSKWYVFRRGLSE